MDNRKILDSLLGNISMQNPAVTGAMGSFAGSLLGSVLARGGGKRMMPGGLLQTGGLAAIGYIAWQAYQRHQAKNSGAQPSPAPTLAQIESQPALPQAVPAAFNLEAKSQSALGVVAAMVAASRADGTVEPSERERIFARVDQLQLTPDENNYVMQLLTQPVDLDGIVKAANTRELALEIYTASALAVHPASRTERAYLDMLAGRLGLEEALLQELDRGVETALQR